MSCLFGDLINEIIASLTAKVAEMNADCPCAGDINFPADLSTWCGDPALPGGIVTQMHTTAALMETEGCMYSAAQDPGVPPECLTSNYLTSLKGYIDAMSCPDGLGTCELTHTPADRPDSAHSLAPNTTYFDRGTAIRGDVFDPGTYRVTYVSGFLYMNYQIDAFSFETRYGTFSRPRGASAYHVHTRIVARDVNGDVLAGRNIINEVELTRSTHFTSGNAVADLSGPPPRSTQITITQPASISVETRYSNYATHNNTSIVYKIEKCENRCEPTAVEDIFTNSIGTTNPLPWLIQFHRNRTAFTMPGDALCETTHKLWRRQISNCIECSEDLVFGDEHLVALAPNATSHTFLTETEGTQYCFKVDAIIEDATTGHGDRTTTSYHCKTVDCISDPAQWGSIDKDIYLSGIDPNDIGVGLGSVWRYLYMNTDALFTELYIDGELVADSGDVGFDRVSPNGDFDPVGHGVPGPTSGVEYRQEVNWGIGETHGVCWRFYDRCQVANGKAEWFQLCKVIRIIDLLVTPPDPIDPTVGSVCPSSLAFTLLPGQSKTVTVAAGGEGQFLLTWEVSYSGESTSGTVAHMISSIFPDDQRESVTWNDSHHPGTTIVNAGDVFTVTNTIVIAGAPNADAPGTLTITCTPL